MRRITREEAIQIARSTVMAAVEKAKFSQPYIAMVEGALDDLIDTSKLKDCDDAISREAAIEALDAHKYSNDFCVEHNIDWSINFEMAHIILNELPAVYPNPKKGMWVRKYSRPNVYQDTYWYCSACDAACKYEWAQLFAYCPNCGANMEVGK